MANLFKAITDLISTLVKINLILQLRPPQPAVYLFVFDVSHNAIEAGYLEVVCQSLLENLDK